MEQGTLGEFAGSEAADGDRPAEEAAAVAGTERAGADADIVEV